MKINVTAEDMDYFSVGYKVGKWLFEDINKDSFEVGITSSRMLIPPELLIQVDVGYISISDAEVVLPEELLPYFSEIYRKDSDYKKFASGDSGREATYTVIPATSYEFVIQADTEIFRSLVGTFWMGNMKATKLNLIVTVKSLYPVNVEELFSGSDKLQVSFKPKEIIKAENE